MNNLTEALGVLVPIVGAIMVLSIFFKILARIGRKEEVETQTLSFKGILDDKTKITVHILNGAAYENVRLIGFTHLRSEKNHFPHELRELVVLEEESGKRVLIQAKTIRMIEVPPPLASNS